MIERRITGFHRDREHHWVAELECGHGQHVRHRPPWINRPWVLTDAGRRGAIGRLLSCSSCRESVAARPAPADSDTAPR